MCKVLTTNDWKDFEEVADELGWSGQHASKLLGDVYRAGYADHQPIDDDRGHQGKYEYQLRDDVEFY